MKPLLLVTLIFKLVQSMWVFN